MLMEPLSDKAIVILCTVPSIIFLTFRFGEISLRQYKSLNHHICHALKAEYRKKDAGILPFAIHVVTALSLLLASPFLAYLMIPNKVFLKEQSPTALVFLTAVALAEVIANGSAFRCILPHPSRYKTYSPDKRTFVRGLGLMYAASLQFTGMAMSSLILLLENNNSTEALRLLLSVLVPAMYLWAVGICVSECINSKWAWEEQFWARPVIQNLMGYGVKSQSKLAQAFANTETFRKQAALVSMYSIFGISGILAFIQSLAMLMHGYIILPPSPVPKSQELYLIVLYLYVTLIMSSGFFTVIQSIFEAESNPPKQQRNDVKLLLEVILTQVCPMLLLAVGPAWIGSPSFADFFSKFLLWTG